MRRQKRELCVQELGSEKERVITDDESGSFWLLVDRRKEETGKIEEQTVIHGV